MALPPSLAQHLSANPLQPPQDSDSDTDREDHRSSSSQPPNINAYQYSKLVQQKQLRLSIASLLPSVTSGAGSHNISPPPHISKSGLQKAIALLRFILFPDYLWQPERHRYTPPDANVPTLRSIAANGSIINPSAEQFGAVPHYFERSLLSDARVCERHRVLRVMVGLLKGQKAVDKGLADAAANKTSSSNKGSGTYLPTSTSGVGPHGPVDPRERDEAVLAALIRFTEILEMQIHRGLMAVAYEERTNPRCQTSIGANRSKARPVRREGNNGGRPKFDLNWLPDHTAPTECAVVAANGQTTGVSDPAALHRRARYIVMFLIERLPKLRVLLHLDVEAVFLHDVAANSIGEVVLCYPGIYFMVHQRLAHELYLLGAPNHVTRLLTEIAHTKTGIDIHPHTSIGHSFFMDHCTGIVIGATSIIGNRVSIYQGVTLGAKAFPLDPETGEKIKNLPRHPIIEDDVTIYANASVLGRVTIGSGSVIGGNVWVAQSIPPNTTVLQGPVNLKIVSDDEAKQQKKERGDAKIKMPSVKEVLAKEDQLASNVVRQSVPPKPIIQQGDGGDSHMAGLGRHRAAHMLGESFLSSHL